MRRLTDDDKRLGVITYGRTAWRALSFVVSSGDDDEDKGNTLTIYACGFVARIVLPNLIPPYREKRIAKSWDAATVARMGRDWYYATDEREFGFRLSDGHLSIMFGRQSMSSSTERTWSTFLPWTQWRHVRTSFYDARGNHFWTEPKRQKGQPGLDRIRAETDKCEACPFESFVFQDYDGTLITATTRIEEREWHFGEGWFKWLSWFRRPKIRRSLDIQFSAEVGREKGSWNGGTIGTGIDMLPHELHESAFRRFCELDHRSKSGPYRVSFVRKLPKVGN